MTSISPPLNSPELRPSLTDPGFLELYQNSPNKDNFFIDFYRSFNDLKISDFNIIVFNNIKEMLKRLIKARNILIKDCYRYKNDFNALLQKLNAENVKFVELEATCSQATFENNELKNENAKLKQQMSELQALIFSLQKLQNESEKREEETNELRIEITKFKEEAMNYSKLLAKSNECCEKLKNELKETTIDYEKVKAELEETDNCVYNLVGFQLRSKCNNLFII
jgi:chromosome segregation ATPase